MARSLALLVLTAGFAGAAAAPSHKQSLLLQTYNKALDSADAKGKDTPVTRVVNLLKEMSKTLQKEMEEDEELNHQLGCWCNNNNYEKDASIEASTAKISELEATIESLTAKSGELSTSIQELEAELASDKKALGEAQALRNKQIQEFQGMETDSIQAVENLKAALTVLSKHHGAGSDPDSTVAGGAVFKSERDSWSLLQKDAPSWTEEHEAHRMDRDLEEFMDRHGFSGATDGPAALAADKVASRKFLRSQESMAPDASFVQSNDDAIVQKALKSARAFLQAHNRDGYQPAYTSQSGEIVGVLKQLKEEMEGDLSEAQKKEADRAAAFDELKSAKTSEIANGEKMAEQKEDELANTNNALAEAKEDLGQEKKVLSEDQKFLANLKKTCATADADFAERKKARLSEIKAVSETIEILQADDARDAMSGTYNFFQVSSSRGLDARRHAAALKLREAAKKTKSPALSALATTVELDAFTKVKKAIDDMIATLKTQQADEVKKNDWCKDEIQSNEMTTAKTEDHKTDLQAQKDELESNIKALEEGIDTAKKNIAQLQLDLQRATEDRQKENLEYQKTIADQMVTIEVLKKALDKLATFYDKEFFVQKKAQGAKKQTPPVPQMEYKANEGSSGVMQMIEKLIVEAKDLMADSKKSESEAQAAYEQTIADTNASVSALQKEVVTKTKAKAKATKDKLQTESDIADTIKELEGLAAENGDLHKECDYVMKNFMVRQEARGQEIEALQQAKQILSGASLS